MTPIDTAELERLAESITPGPWNSSIHGTQVLTGDSWNTICEIRVRKDFSAAQWEDGRGSSDPTANARAIALVPALIREVLAHRKAEAWQPIETAPHETLVVLGWYEGDVWKQEIALASAGTRYPNGYSDLWQHGRASHWRSLPAPPTTPEAEGGCDERA